METFLSILMLTYAFVVLCLNASLQSEPEQEWKQLEFDF